MWLYETDLAVVIKTAITLLGSHMDSVHWGLRFLIIYVPDTDRRTLLGANRSRLSPRNYCIFFETTDRRVLHFKTVDYRSPHILRLQPNNRHDQGRMCCRCVGCSVSEVT